MAKRVGRTEKQLIKYQQTWSKLVSQMEGNEAADLFAGVGTEIQTTLERGILAACLFVEGDAKKRAPVDTGKLRNSISHRVVTDYTGVVGEVGTNVEYGPFMEFGTRYVVPRPFLTPAANENKSAILKIIAEQIKKEL